MGLGMGPDGLLTYTTSPAGYAGLGLGRGMPMQAGVTMAGMGGMSGVPIQPARMETVKEDDKEWAHH
ncbi:hypothetical protein BT69DRAFT_1286446 [Atractiella rhizophila]|nr:hypothetical protein BT69DRAFT_1286446 [Atractiella rhizophila]